MKNEPQAASYRPRREILQLMPKIADEVEAARFPEAILRFRNDRSAATVGLDALNDEQWVDHFARFQPLPDSLQRPLAMRYHGHQFRTYNPEIGDGRGFLFAQMLDADGRLLDLGTKGSGTTPYSRSGDGRLTLKGGVREILATEMLEALGVETSKSFSLVETGEELWRGDEPSPTRSAVLVRLSHSHIRFGTFQRIAYERDEAAMHALIQYCLNNFYAGADTGDTPAVTLLHRVVERHARLAASYMVAGFVHGVLNTDNMNITGESFDYGPWRFAPKWEPGFTAAYFDHSGLYALGRQPEALHWNLAQLAIALRLIAPSEPLVEALERYGPLYRDELARLFCWRLGFEPQGGDKDTAMIESAEKLMAQDETGIDRFFFDWMGRSPETDEMSQAGRHLAECLASYRQARTREHSYWNSDTPHSILIEEVEAIWDAIAKDDDWTPLQAKIAAIREMGEALLS